MTTTGPTPTTPRLGLPKPIDDATTWGDDYRRAMDALDAHPGVLMVLDGTVPAVPYDGQIIVEQVSHRLLTYSATTRRWTPPVTASPTYRHDQGVSASQWMIVHSLGYLPNVSAFDTIGVNAHGDVTHLSATTLTIDFQFPFGGYAVLS